MYHIKTYVEVLRLSSREAHCWELPVKLCVCQFDNPPVVIPIIFLPCVFSLSPSVLQSRISTATTYFCSGSSWSWWLWASSERLPSLWWSGKQQQLLLPVARTTAAFDLDTVPCATGGKPLCWEVTREGEKIKMLQQLRWKKLLHQSEWTWNTGEENAQFERLFSCFNQLREVCMFLKTRY